MTKRMLIDAAHPEETRVVVIDGNRLEEFDFESSTKKQLKGNIYLAKVVRVLARIDHDRHAVSDVDGLAVDQRSLFRSGPHGTGASYQCSLDPGANLPF